MKVVRSALAAVAFSSTLAGAQALPDRSPPRVDVVTLLQLDSRRAELVEAIFENAHERAAVAQRQIGTPSDDTTRATLFAAMYAIRLDADKQLEAVLTSEELAKLRAVIPPPAPGERKWKRFTSM
jgi:hypothetical protein